MTKAITLLDFEAQLPNSAHQLIASAQKASTSHVWVSQQQTACSGFVTDSREIWFLKER
jgi:hypothetical protein